MDETLKSNLRAKLIAELEAVKKDKAFWKAQPAIEISDSRGGMRNFRTVHLSTLEIEWADIIAALKALERPDV